MVNPYNALWFPSTLNLVVLLWLCETLISMRHNSSQDMAWGDSRSKASRTDTWQDYKNWYEGLPAVVSPNTRLTYMESNRVNELKPRTCRGSMTSGVVTYHKIYVHQWPTFTSEVKFRDRQVIWNISSASRPSPRSLFPLPKYSCSLDIRWPDCWTLSVNKSGLSHLAKQQSELELWLCDPIFLFAKSDSVL